MSIDAGEVERVLVAIADAATPAATRAQYNQAIEDLKEGPGEVLLSLSMQLASSQNPVIVHFALNFVQHAIKFKWNSLDVQTRISLKDEILRRMQIGPPPTPTIPGHSSHSLSSVSHWAEPLAGCVTAMAEHEWPQNWSEMGEKLRTMAIQAASPSTSIAVLCVIRRLIEDVVNFANVANPKRRREMAAAIHECMKPWLGMCIQLFADARHDSEESLLVVKHVIGLLSIMVESATTPDMEPLIDEMVNHLVRFLSTASHSIYEEAALCLTGIASRKKASVAEKVVVDTFFRDNVIKALLETTSMAAHVAHSNEDHYKYLKALCDTLTTVGLHLVSVWTLTAEKTCKSPPPPANFGLYMSALSEFAQHPSLFLRSEATHVLIRLSSSPHTRKWKELRATLRDKILPRLVELSERTGMPSSTVASDAAHYARMDYDDDVEWVHDFTQYRTRIFNLVRETMDDHHEVLLNMVEQRILHRVAMDPNTIPLHEWDGLHKLSKAVLSLAFEKQLVENRREVHETNAYKMIIDTIGTKSTFATANEALSVLASLHPLMDRQPQLIEPLLNLLERLSIASAALEEKELKRHLTSTLISITTKHEKVAKEYWQRIFEVTKIMAQSASLMQESQIANVLAALSNVVDSESDKKQLLEIALAPQLQRLEQMQGIFKNAHSFLEQTGFLVGPPASIAEAEKHDGVINRKMIRSTLCAIEGIVQKVDADSPIGPILVPKCEAFARLVRILFDLYDPTTPTVVHAAYSGLLQIPYSERQVIYCTVGENLEAATGNRPRHNEDARASITLAIQFLSEINDTCQSIISICASKFSSIFYSLPSLQSILADCTANLERLPDFRVRYWLKKAWQTLVICAPSSALPTIFPFLSTIVEHCQRRSERVWAQVSTIDYDSEPTEDELFLEHMTCVMSRELIGFLKTVFVHEEKHTTANTGNAAAISVSLSPLGCAVYNQGGPLLSSFVTITFSALAWRDTQSCVRAIPVAKAIVDKLAESFNEEAAVFAMVNVLQSIRIHGSDEVAIGPLLTIIFHTYSALRPHSPQLRAVLEQLPDTPAATIEAFDKRAIAISRGLEEMPEKARKDMVRKLLRPIISVTLGELGRRPVELRPLPPIEKRAKPAEEEADYAAVGDFFGH
ncbi:hypothetical protein PMAYCL1PPCAC_03289 [Pristionchus mayeri]|uniref:Exportin-5 C-terminal domain-containing protein n=1 Tax=Pristionchus mayeri TaxID=1317129 RepID=A0AAN5C8S9_9BILA|nr:hypothetical protein PMAYCL1PPCAC_03289 [Pristionchus mayeri]